MADTPTPTSPLFRIPSAEEIYDALMGQIEPELVSANIPVLDRNYANETPAEHQARYDRYRTAYEKYDQAFAAWSLKLNTAVTHLKRSVLTLAEQNDRATDEATMTNMESAFGDIQTTA